MKSKYQKETFSEFLILETASDLQETYPSTHQEVAILIKQNEKTPDTRKETVDVIIALNCLQVSLGALTADNLRALSSCLFRAAKRLEGIE